MGWIIAVVVVVLIAMWLDSAPGKVVMGAGVVALGLLILSWITGADFLITLAKACAVIIVVVITAALLLAIIKK